MSDEDSDMEWELLSDEQRLLQGITHEMYCTLCGVPFHLVPNKRHRHSKNGEDCCVWSSYFLALRIPKVTQTWPNSSVCITGIGQHDQQQPRLPPPGYDIRVLSGRGPIKKLRILMNEEEKKEWISFEGIYSPQYALDKTAVVLPSIQLIVDSRWHLPDPVKTVYLMHPRCWDILLQQHALVTSPTKTCLDLDLLAKIFLQIPLGKRGGGFRPDWATDYAGPEQCWWTNIVDNFEQEREWHFLIQDPGIACGFDELFANPPLESAANNSPRIISADDGGEIFSRLPPEILTEILVLLPSASVRNLQLASRRMASVYLSSRCWRSRFEFPNELCHVTLPPALLRSGQVDGQWVDWRRLCDQLLHPVGEGFGWWQNRKRITALNKSLVKSMSLRRSDGRLKDIDGVQTLQ